MPSEDEVRDALKAIFDPDVPANIVDLGLVYDVRVDGASATIRMSLTRPGSPLADDLSTEVQEHLLETLPDIDEVLVEIVWDPPWHPDRMSEEARANLGM